MAFGALDSATLAASGAGAVSAGVQRITLASDDPAVAALQILDNAIAGNEMQVDVVAMLPAGTNNIGNVDVETYPPTADVTMQNAAVATGNGTLLTVTGYGTATIQITGTFVATVTFEGTANGTDFVSILATQGSASAITTTATAPGIFRLSVAGLTSIRARISAFTSGSVTALGRATNAPFGTKVVSVSGLVTAAVTSITNALPAGTNNIGDVDVLSIAAGNNNIGDVDVASIAAGDNNIGNVDIVTLPATTVAGATVKTADLDTGAGTDTVPIMGVAVGAAGGAIAITGDATNGLDVDVTRVTGTVTVANGGTFATQVNGDALTSLQLIDNLVLAEDSVHASLDPGVQALAVRKATPANLSGADGDYEPLQVNAGRLWVDPSGVTLTVASHAVTNAGVFAVQVDAALPAGANAIGKLAANTGVDIGDVDVTSISAGTNLIGDVGIQGRTTGGLSFYKTIDLDETEEEVKATAGTLYSILAFNRTAAPLYLKFYNATAANVIVGTTVPDMTLVVPANADSDGAGFTHSVAQGYAFGTAISMAATTGVADADAGAPGVNDCVVLVGYK